MPDNHSTPDNIPHKRQAHGWAGTVGDLVTLSLEHFVSELTGHVRALFGYLDHERLDDILASQIRAWTDEHEVMTSTAARLVAQHPHSTNWGVIFEYELPQEGGRRPDVIVLAGRTVVVLEFKMKNQPTPGDLDQLDGYLRDLEDFHSVAQTAAAIHGTIVLTRGEPSPADRHRVITPAEITDYIVSRATDGDTPIEHWLDGDYQPAPGLIANAISNWTRAPQTIKTVEATNIPQAEQAIHRIIRNAPDHPGSTRHLIFLTGTPGAGKTFVGMNLVHSDIPGVSMRFLSGNGPLVKVLNYALQQRQQLITPIHRYREWFEQDHTRVPRDNVLVFDEAQRSLDAEKMHSTFRIGHSEPHSMLRIVTRMRDWGVFVLLVGNGQEIHNGESGLELWFEELRNDFPDTDWVLHIDPRQIPNVTTPFSTPDLPAGSSWSDHMPPNVTLAANPDLHLTTSIRTHRAGTFHHWVNLLLEGRLEDAALVARQAQDDHYGIYVTRNLDTARTYLRDRYDQAPDSRYGIVIGSRNQAIAQRHRISVLGARNSRGVRVTDATEKWWVDPQDHPRSCCQLDTAATEFECQGLDLDTTVLFWADDITWNTNRASWDVKNIQTSNPPLADPRQTRLNVYRVLLTRGRDSLILFVPPEPQLDSTYDSLLRGGAVSLG